MSDNKLFKKVSSSETDALVACVIRKLLVWPDFVDIEQQKKYLLSDVQKERKRSRISKRCGKASVDPAHTDESSSIVLRSFEQVERSVRWAFQSWEALYAALTIQKSDSKFELLSSPCEEYVLRIALLGLCPNQGQCFLERSMVFVKQSLAYVAAAAFQQTERGTVDDALRNHSGRPLPGILAGGWVGRLLHRIMIGAFRDRKSCISLGLNVLMSKIGNAPAPEEFIEKAFKDHAKALGTVHEINPLYTSKVLESIGTDRASTSQDTGIDKDAISRRVDEISGTIHENISRICEHLFEGHTMRIKDSFPSLNASYEVVDLPEKIKNLGSALLGGAYGSLLRKFGMEYGLEYDHSQLPIYDVNTSSIHQAYGGVDGRELIGFNNDQNPIYAVEIPVPDIRPLHYFQKMVDKMTTETLSQDFVMARPAAVPEPLKVRMVTSGEPAPYFRSLEIQKFMHGVLRECPVFRFIGRPASDEDFDKMFPFPLRAGWKYVSGDYKAATDNLNPEFSRAVWDAICRVADYEDGTEEIVKDQLDSNIHSCEPDFSNFLNNLFDEDGGAADRDYEKLKERVSRMEVPELTKSRAVRRSLLLSPWHKLGTLCLTGHHLDYRGLFPGGTIIDQEWGQLMGSPMSFPVLCIVNFAASCAGLGVDPIHVINYMTFLDGFSGADWDDSDPNFSDAVMDVASSTHPRALTPIYVNGDDIGFCCPESRYMLWEEAVTIAGLTPSIGKNYTSTEFIIINSELRIQSPREDGTCSWTHLNYVNLSLLWGYEKKGPDAGKDVRDKMHWTDLGPRCKTLIKNLPYGQELVLQKFMQCHSEILSTVPANIGYFIPRSLLGVGLPCLTNSLGYLHPLCNIRNENLQTAAWFSCLDSKKQEQLARPPRKGEQSPLADMAKAVETKLSDLLGGKVRKPREYLRTHPESLGSGYMMAEILNNYLETMSSEGGIYKSKFSYIFDEKLMVRPPVPSDTPKIRKDKRPEIILRCRLRDFDRELSKSLSRANVRNTSLEPMRLFKAIRYSSDWKWGCPWERITYTRTSRWQDSASAKHPTVDVKQ